jgi:hypothetical protein
MLCVIKIRVRDLRVADEAWLALASLQRGNPARQDFSAGEIFERVRSVAVHASLRPGVAPHISLHNVANVPANSARHRMFYRTPSGRYRLFRPGDDFHPSRTGKTKPERDELPEQYQELLDWYEKSYCAGGANIRAVGEDPFLAMRGVGQEIWAGVNSDAYVDSLRAGWEFAGRHEPREHGASLPRGGAAATENEKVWARIERHQGQEFKTKRGLSFTHKVEGSNGIWFFRKGKRIERRLRRGEVEKALHKLPLEGPSDIKEFRDSSYLYGLLTDGRIVGEG